MKHLGWVLITAVVVVILAILAARWFSMGAVETAADQDNFTFEEVTKQIDSLTIALTDCGDDANCVQVTLTNASADLTYAVSLTKVVVNDAEALADVFDAEIIPGGENSYDVALEPDAEAGGIESVALWFEVAESGGSSGGVEAILYLYSA